MLIVLISLYVLACLTSNRTATLIAGTVAAALLHPAAAVAALLIAAAAYVTPNTIFAARCYAAIALGIVVAKNSLASGLASDLVGVSFVLFQGYYTILKPPQSVMGIPNGAANLLFYPQLLCGPIIPPRAYHAPEGRRVSSRKAQYAHCLFAAGLILKIWCADVLAIALVGPTTGIFHLPLLFVQIYADFAGWCLMGSAIGLACGIAIPRNFRFPFRRKTAAAFWNSWNITLNVWVRATMPLRQVAPHLGRFGGIVVFCGVLGLWHGLFAQFFLFMLVNILIFLWQARTNSPTWLLVSRLVFYVSIPAAFFGRLPNTWIGLAISDLDRVAIAVCVALLLELGGIRRIFHYRATLMRFWWLMPSVIALLFALRPPTQAFMYTLF